MRQIWQTNYKGKLGKIIKATDYFCTCDDRFLKRAKEADTSQTKVVSPLELITELVQ